MDIKPFKAFRPVRDKVHLVVSRPFYAYKKNVLKAKLQSNPFSFLHIISPEFNLLNEEPKELEVDHRLKKVSSQYRKFIDKGVLIKEEFPTIYVYRQTNGDHVYTGIIAATSAQDYNEGRIKKHEATITKREKIFAKYLDIVGYNAEPVLLSHETIPKLNETLEAITAERPEYEFTTSDTFLHELWVLPAKLSEEVSSYFKSLDKCYIADGHHRTASSAALNQNRMEGNRSFTNDGFILSFLIDENKLNVYEFNRIVRNVVNLSESELVQILSKNFQIKSLTEKRKPCKEHEIVMIMNDNWYSLTCNEEIIEKEHPIRSLDAEILTNYVLSPVLGIKDLKTDTNVSFISGIESFSKLRKKMTKGGFDIAFLLHPVSMDQVKNVADNNMIMPPKTTWVEPKMRSGLTIYALNE